MLHQVDVLFKRDHIVSLQGFGLQRLFGAELAHHLTCPVVIRFHTTLSLVSHLLDFGEHFRSLFVLLFECLDDLVVQVECQIPLEGRKIHLLHLDEVG